MAKFVTLVLFILVVEAVGAFIGITFAPGDWYQSLNKPFFNPPSAVFGIVWPVLYLFVAVAGWRVFSSEGDLPGWGHWVAQMALNWLWSPVFFGAQELFLSIWIIAGMFISSLLFILKLWDRDRFSSVLFIPYAGWLGFALALNTAIWALN